MSCLVMLCHVMSFIYFMFSFVATYQKGESRYLVTHSMQTGPSYMLQFEMVMGCSHLFVPDMDNKVRLQSKVTHT